MLANEDFQDDTVNLIVGAVIGQHFDFGLGLAEAIDTPLSLFVSGGVPAQVVMDDRVE